MIGQRLETTTIISDMRTLNLN